MNRRLPLAQPEQCSGEVRETFHSKMIMKFHAALSLAVATVSVCQMALSSAHAADVEAISARTSADYIRTRAPDGSFKPEAYAFGEGGYWGGPISDSTIDKLKFTEIARDIAGPLASQNYLPSKDAKTTRLLVMVYWGTTIPTVSPDESATLHNVADAAAQLKIAYARQVHRGLGKGEEHYEWDNLMAALAAEGAEETVRDKADGLNAMLLGYDSLWDQTYGAPWASAQDLERRDMLNELEAERYFVILMAYDFQLMWKEKKHKLLWETRFSISERRHQFDTVLPGLAMQASKYFGTDSKGLVRDEVPAGHVDIGQVKSLGSIPDK
jgi:hypothetical protein